MNAVKDKMKQRSFYMDDETYQLIADYAGRLGASNGTALRMLVRHKLLDAPAEPVSLPAVQQSVRDGTFSVKSASIALPPDNQETFKVPEKFRDRGGPPRPKHEDDDF